MSESHRQPGRWHRLATARVRTLWGVKPAFPPQGRRRTDQGPAWVRGFVAIGRPAVAVTVLGLCAPGEHHLAVLAGWDDRLAWGMAAVLAAYAGIAAAVAGSRPRGTPGHWTAVLGAALSLLLAMAAQPISHLFVTGWLTATPRPPVWLIVSVSCVPPFVMGHLLHLAATPTVRTELPEPQPAPVVPEGFLTTKEVAQRLGIKPSSVGTRVSRGTLVPAMRDPDLGNLFDPATLQPESVTA